MKIDRFPGFFLIFSWTSLEGLEVRECVGSLGGCCFEFEVLLRGSLRVFLGGWRFGLGEMKMMMMMR